MSSKVAEVLVQVDPHSIAEAKVVLDEGGVPTLGKEAAFPVLVVGPDRVDVQPAACRLLEAQTLPLPFGPEGTDRSNADVGAVLLITMSRRR
ncbi:hypothetical protein COT87_01750 [Candidatus Collierbacteria bacterium CG10_big_fil_rev_8_21_14_0_10_44_9]|uniref:Uncharacterized protein n=1 Tax=Candidatus Collierbacteria bacterium CG10_big_fil_rev_8_21_14_0_10_44_9 TaxID=1974535 RepID=A0A2H0VIR7_9BACT|nr:MAG: hypothetical protein COT87_01750 [Candidatus Collierbacteria bacterium CG10_big_fil_rev_8_21_14_0_10_44_9]